MAYKLTDGFMWNPILKIPRNDHCPCGSGKKFKKCHLKDTPRALNIEHLENIVKNYKPIK